jgi:two-component system phosphate regulon sensor histidine kinase PhoR
LFWNFFLVFIAKIKSDELQIYFLEDIIHDFDTDIGFKELEEKVHEMNQKNAEIDMMKEMENYRKEYIGNVSHELKTPCFRSRVI